MFIFFLAKKLTAHTRPASSPQPIDLPSLLPHHRDPYWGRKKRTTLAPYPLPPTPPRWQTGFARKGIFICRFVVFPPKNGWMVLFCWKKKTKRPLAGGGEGVSQCLGGWGASENVGFKIRRLYSAFKRDVMRPYIFFILVIHFLKKRKCVFFLLLKMSLKGNFSKLIVEASRNKTLPGESFLFEGRYR